MNYLARAFESTTKAFLGGQSVFLNQIRGKKVKAKSYSRNPPRKKNPKRRGIKASDGVTVSENKIIVLQNKLQFHPGLNVGFGKNGTLFALVPGRVIFTCERFDPNWEHTWVQRIYAGREDQTIHKKYANVIPFEQHNRFKLIDTI